jgi:hypothetical protein
MDQPLDYDQLHQTLRTDYHAVIDRDLSDHRESASFHTLLVDIVRSYLEDLNTTAMVGLRISRLADHVDRLERRADQKRTVIARAMLQADIETLLEPEFFVERTEVPGQLVVTDEKAIPKAFRTGRPAVPNRAALLAALQAGEVIPEAMLGAPEVNVVVSPR